MPPERSGHPAPDINERKSMLRLLTLSVIQAVFLCGGQVLLKMALNKMGAFSWTWKFFLAQLTNWWFLGCGLTFAVATVLWLYILKNYPFGVAYPLSCLSYLFGLIAALLVFHEPVSAAQWAGVLLIMAGCALIAK